MKIFTEKSNNNYIVNYGKIKNLKLVGMEKIWRNKLNLCHK
jgi:hypothetical protein